MPLVFSKSSSAPVLSASFSYCSPILKAAIKARVPMARYTIPFVTNPILASRSIVVFDEFIVGYHKYFMPA
jgi:hypothetical protein